MRETEIEIETEKGTVAWKGTGGTGIGKKRGRRRMTAEGAAIEAGVEDGRRR